MRIPAFGALLLALSTAQAALNDLGNGLVADTDQGIYWLKDARSVWTACHATSGPEKALWDAFDPENNPGNMGTDGFGLPRDKQWICDSGGIMRWEEAEAWIQVMNQQTYLGYSDWRQPRTPQPDPSCESQITNVAPHPNQGYGYNCRGSELGYLFNVSLGNPNHGGTGATGGTVGTSCAGVHSSCFVNKDPFVNTYHTTAWSGTEYAPDTDLAWSFHFLDGGQMGPNWNYKIGFGNVWPVRSASAIPVPALPLSELATLTLLLGALGWRQYALKSDEQH